MQLFYEWLHICNLLQTVVFRLQILLKFQTRWWLAIRDSLLKLCKKKQIKISATICVLLALTFYWFQRFFKKVSWVCELTASTFCVIFAYLVINFEVNLLICEIWSHRVYSLTPSPKILRKILFFLDFFEQLNVIIQNT